VDVAEAKIMVRETKLFKLLKGARGEKPVDIKALAELISTVSQLPFQYPDLDEMDLNPVFMFQEGLLVGDVRVIRKNK
jgi:acyl-CoA synthetase (NDP forming)